MGFISRKTKLRIILATAIGMLSLTASAGEQLFFKTGTVTSTSQAEVSRFMPQSIKFVPGKNFVVQFKQTVTEADKKALQNQGIRIVSYVPEDAFIVEGPIRVLQTLPEVNEKVRASLPLLTGWRVSPDFGPISIFDRDQVERIVIRLSSKDDSDSVSRQIEQLGSRVLHAQSDSVLVDARRGDIEAIASFNGVIWVQPFTEMKLLPMDFKVSNGEPGTASGDALATATGYESGTKVMGFDEAWNRGYTGAGQIVSMADTGLDGGSVGSLTADFSNTIGGYSFGMFAKDWSDPMGHGTHVAGSIMGNGALSGGLIRGGAFEAEMVAEGMWSPVINNLTVPAQLEDLFAPAYADGARIHSNSWGGARLFGAYDNYAVQVDQFIWDNPQMLVVFAAGNSGTDSNKDGRIDEGTMASPGTAKNVLTVGASENYLLKGGIQRKLGDLLDGEPWGVEPLASDRLSDNPNGIAAFSSRGPTLDGRIKPDVVAPGTNIVSNCSSVNGASKLWGNFNQDYCYSGGTSMSTPLVAGGAALVRQYLETEWNLSTPSAALVKGILMHSADDLYPGQYGEVGKSSGQELLVPGPNPHQGYGRVNMDDATNGSYFIHLIDNTSGIAQGEVYELSIPAQGLNAIKVTMIYTDAPGSENASKALVNDLDLEVLVGGESFKTENRIDNHEQLLINDLAVDEVTVKIHGVSVPMGKDGKQPVALLVSEY